MSPRAAASGHTGGNAPPPRLHAVPAAVTTEPPVMFLSWKDTARCLSLSESSIRRLVKAGEIPPPIPLTLGRVGFNFEDVEAYRQRVIARSRSDGRPGV